MLAPLSDRGTCSLPVAPSARMISSTRSGSFVGYTPTESPTSKLNPQPVRSSSKWRVSFSDSGPLSRRLISIVAGNGFVREYGEGSNVAQLQSWQQHLAANCICRKCSPGISNGKRGANFCRALRSAISPGISNCLRNKARGLVAIAGSLPSPPRRPVRRNREIDLPLEEINARDKHRHVVADLESLA